MSIWLRYLAVAVLIGNTFAAVSDLMLVGWTLKHGAFDDLNAFLAIKLAVAFSAITLASLIAAPGQRELGLPAKLLAVVVALGGGFDVLSLSMDLRTLMALSNADPLKSAQDTYFVGNFVLERVIQSAFFSLCTVALAVRVLVSRRVSAA